MRQILFIIIIGFFSISNVYALKFEKCYTLEPSDKEFKKDFMDRGFLFDRFNKDKFEASYYQIFSDGSAEKVVITTDKYRKQLNKKIDEDFKDKDYATPEFLAELKEKIKRTKYKVTFANENYITLEEIMDKRINIKVRVNLDLKTGKVTLTDWMTGDPSAIKQCEISSKGKSGLLDYWWALILIIAITFFVYTQSATRLKKLKIRK